jgi:hypothetical protein
MKHANCESVAEITAQRSERVKVDCEQLATRVRRATCSVWEGGGRLASQGGCSSAMRRQWLPTPGCVLPDLNAGSPCFPYLPSHISRSQPQVVFDRRFSIACHVNKHSQSFQNEVQLRHHRSCLHCCSSPRSAAKHPFLCCESSSSPI